MKMTVMTLGYVKFSVDYENIEKAFTNKGKKELKKFVEVTPIVSTPAKIKVNTKKRTSVNNMKPKQMKQMKS